MIPRALYHSASDEVLGLIYQVGEMTELRRGGPEMDGAECGEDEEEPEGSVAEGVVGDGCHEGEEEGEQKVEVGREGGVFHIREGTHFWGCITEFWSSFILEGQIDAQH
jgi:hypothetical protein